MAFEKHYDKNVKAVVTSRRHQEKLMNKKGIADVREWKDPEDIQKEAARNLLERRQALNAPTAEAVKKALHDAEAGEDYLPALEARLEEDAKKMEADMDRAQALRRENEEEDRRRWEHDHR